MIKYDAVESGNRGVIVSIDFDVRVCMIDFSLEACIRLKKEWRSREESSLDVFECMFIKMVVIRMDL